MIDQSLTSLKCANSAANKHYFLGKAGLNILQVVEDCCTDYVIANQDKKGFFNIIIQLNDVPSVIVIQN